MLACVDSFEYGGGGYGGASIAVVSPDVDKSSADSDQLPCKAKVFGINDTCLSLAF